MYLDGAMLDEYSLYRPSVFSTIVRPALSDRLGWAVFAGTPKGKNAFYKQLVQAKQYPEEYFSLVLSADSSGILPPSELIQLRRDMDPEEFAQEYLCSFDAAIKGAIYASELNDAFMEGRVKPSIYDENLPVNVVYDLGFTDATVATFWQEHPDGTLLVVAVYATTGQDIFHHIEQLKQFPGELGDVWLPHDARARNLQTGRSIVEQFLKEDIKVKLVPSHKVRDRIAASRKLFPRIVFQQGDTDDLVEALKGYRRDYVEKLATFVETPLHDWCSDYADSFGYMCLVAANSRFGRQILSTKALPGIEDLEVPLHYNLSSLWLAREERRARIGPRIN
jgi:hypothetical protein